MSEKFYIKEKIATTGDLIIVNRNIYQVESVLKDGSVIYINQDNLTCVAKPNFYTVIIPEYNQIHPHFRMEF